MTLFQFEGHCERYIFKQTPKMVFVVGLTVKACGGNFGNFPIVSSIQSTLPTVHNWAPKIISEKIILKTLN
jgi:hypothetical protein